MPPEDPVRQWMLSLPSSADAVAPFALRYRLAYDASLTTALLGTFVRTALRFSEAPIPQTFGSSRRR